MAGIFFSIFLLLMSFVVLVGGSANKSEMAFDEWLRKDEIRLNNEHKQIIAEGEE